MINVEPCFGESATGSIAHFSSSLDYFGIPVEYPPPSNMKVASSSCLARKPEKRTLEPVQLPFLGLSVRSAV